MLGKLIKHDFRAFSRTLLPLQLGVLGGGLLAAVLARLTALLIGTNASGAATGFLWLFGALSALLTGLLFIAICSSALVTLVLICIRVQKSFFGDEGYLTFSLPTTTGRLLWSKIITGTVWLVINSLIILLTMFLFGLFGTTQETFVNMDVLRGLGSFFGGFGDLFVALFTADATPGMWLMAILGVIDVLAGLLLAVLSLYFAVIAGGMMAKKHKLLAAIAVYFAIHFCLGFVLAVCGAFAIAVVSVANPLGAVWLMLVGALIVLGGLSTGLFFWARQLLKNRLNLQ